ncbi:MAG TPA: cache domain-containing protein [Candidatus Binatia bacterium]|nr:cache domain-containing protein [Candidatus Binatia bacterium]
MPATLHRRSWNAIILTLASIAVLHASDRGTAVEARTMLLKAIAHYQSVGRKQALADFTARRPPFADRDLYVFCLGPQHTVVATGGFPNVIGAQEDSLIDVDGNGVGTTARTLTSKGIAPVRYRWVNPVTHNIEHKVTYFAKVGEDVCGVGAYTGR